MASYKKKGNFFDTEEGAKMKASLRLMQQNTSFSTEASYSANAANHPDNLISFVDKHMNYLNAHQNVNPDHYLANLRLVTRLK